MPGRGVRIPESLRQTVVEYAQRNNLGARETARALGKPRSTVQRIMDEYKERGHCKPLPGYRRGSAGRSKEKGNLQIPSMNPKKRKKSSSGMRSDGGMPRGGAGQAGPPLREPPMAPVSAAAAIALGVTPLGVTPISLDEPDQLTPGNEARDSVYIFFNDELADATDGFDIGLKIGDGGAGQVFKAKPLSRIGNKSEMAIKKMDFRAQGQVELLQLVQALGTCRHEHVLPLIGFSADRGRDGQGSVCLISPLMKGGSLEDRMFPRSAGGGARIRLISGREGQLPTPLRWIDRVRVAVSVAKALEYLHAGDPGNNKPCILHRNVKPSNILLDASGHVRLGDVGVAMVPNIDPSALNFAAVVGGKTIGFIDPNYVSTGQFDQASDAYSLGVVVLILLTGWRAVDSEKFIYHRCQNKDVEEVADKKAKWPDDVAKEMLEVGMGLSDPSKMTRMKMATAIEKLEPILSQQPTVGRVVERDCIACMAWPRVVRLPCGHTAWCRRCLNFALDRGEQRCPHCKRGFTKDDIAASEKLMQQAKAAELKAQQLALQKAMGQGAGGSSNAPNPNGASHNNAQNNVPPPAAPAIPSTPGQPHTVQHHQGHQGHPGHGGMGGHGQHQQQHHQQHHHQQQHHQQQHQHQHHPQHQQQHHQQHHQHHHQHQQLMHSSHQQHQGQHNQSMSSVPAMQVGPGQVNLPPLPAPPSLSMPNTPGLVVSYPSTPAQLSAPG